MKETERNRKRLSITLNRGSTLIEVLAAVLLTAVMTSAVFSVALGAKGESKITEEHNSASQCLTQLTNQLHSFVTGYWSYATNNFNANMPEICGPLSNGCVYGSGLPSQWTWASAGVSDSCSGCSYPYVLAVGTHNLTVGSNGLTGLGTPFCMPPWMWQPPYNASLSYTVAPLSFDTSGNQIGGPGVTVTINWSNP
jgi:type II secretory pathway pseudopilin PulG